MSTNIFQGKWAMRYTPNNNYLSGDSNGITATATTITPSETFILYSPGFSAATKCFQGFVQLQSNRQYLTTGECYGPMCKLLAGAPDQSSALGLAWVLEREPAFIFVANNTFSVVGQIFVLGLNDIWTWLFDLDGRPSGGGDFFDVTIITPGLYQMAGSQVWPNLDFSFVDLTGQDFSGSYQFQNCKFQHAVLAGVNLTGANLSSANFSDANLSGAIFTRSTIVGADFTRCNLMGAITDNDTFFAPTQSASFNLSSATLPFYLIGNHWQYLKLWNATVVGIPSSLSSSDNPLQATGAQLSGMNKNDFTNLDLKYAVLDYADVDGLELTGADLSNASLVQSSLHGANLGGATLLNTKMNGAQLGALGYLFTVPLSIAPKLDAGDVSALTDDFSNVGITLSSSAKLTTIVTDQLWELDDVGNDITYTIRLDGPNAANFTVYKPAAAANLVNAYMPNAVLTGANLYAVLANGIQFYGSAAKIDSSAILELAELNDSNLSSLDLTQAQLMGANLSGSYLFNARFNGANLTNSANGSATNLSDANLQGADFTGAQLAGANLKNAAVAIKVATKMNPNQGGVYLFSLPYPGDTNTVQQYIAELNEAAVTYFSLNPNGNSTGYQTYVSALESKQIGPLKKPFLTHSPPITLSNNAQINDVELGSVWQIIDMDRSYTLWTDQVGEQMQLFAQSSLTITPPAFHQNGITLRSQASVTLNTPNQQWLLDNDSENPQNFSTGYMSFLLRVNGSVLDVYGTAIRIVRLGDKNQQEFDTEPCNVTVLGVTNMSGATICPNGISLSVNQSSSGENWDDLWLRASLPPKPPYCVPNGNSYCDPKSTDRTWTG